MQGSRDRNTARFILGFGGYSLFPRDDSYKGYPEERGPYEHRLRPNLKGNFNTEIEGEPKANSTNWFPCPSRSKKDRDPRTKDPYRIYVGVSCRVVNKLQVRGDMKCIRNHETVIGFHIVLFSIESSPPFILTTTAGNAIANAPDIIGSNGNKRPNPFKAHAS